MMPEPHPPHPPTPNLTLRARRLALNLTQSELAELLRATAARASANAVEWSGQSTWASWRRSAA